MNKSDVDLYAENITKWLDSLQLIGKSGLRATKSEIIIKKEIICSIQNAKKLIIDRYILGQTRNFEEDDFAYQFAALTNIVDRISKKFGTKPPEEIKFQQLISKID